MFRKSHFYYFHFLKAFLSVLVEQQIKEERHSHFCALKRRVGREVECITKTKMKFVCAGFVLNRERKRLENASKGMFLRVSDDIQNIMPQTGLFRY